MKDGIVFERDPKCVIGEDCERHYCVHGSEAEELREGLEKLFEEADTRNLHDGACSLRDVGDLEDAYNELLHGIRTLLDTVDACDALALLEHGRNANEDGDDNDDDDGNNDIADKD